MPHVAPILVTIGSLVSASGAVWLVGTKGRGAHRSLGHRCRHAGFRLLIWHDRQKQRQKLAQLEPRLLNDIGVTRAAAIAESRRRD